MFNEIGSEFWIERIPDKLYQERDGVYCLSGRTAIDLILQEILQKRLVQSVAMPAWCCDSMIAPFLAHGIDVKFYDVSLETRMTTNDHESSISYSFSNTDSTDKIDIFYLTNYFGYENTLPIETVKRLKEKGCVILYDRTHSFLMEDEAYQEKADYSFASIRKWMGVVGGAAVNGLTEKTQLKECPYIAIKEKAMRGKYRYLTGDGRVKKDDFLAAFGEFGHQLAADYCNYEMDDLSYTFYKQEDLHAMAKKRRENAAYIQKNLKGVQFIYNLTDNSVPLFVPVLFKTKEQRDCVRKKLIEQQIYCPVHWPQPKQIPASFQVNDIVSRELSLICDQRYGIEEIERIVSQIKQIMQK